MDLDVERAYEAYRWVKATASGDSGCVEVAGRVSSHASGGGGCGDEGRDVAVRNSRDPDGSVLVFTRAEWTAFLAGVRGGEFDDL